MVIKKISKGFILINGIKFPYNTPVNVDTELGEYIKKTFGKDFEIVEEKSKKTNSRTTAKSDSKKTTQVTNKKQKDSKDTDQ